MTLKLMIEPLCSDDITCVFRKKIKFVSDGQHNSDLFRHSFIFYAMFFYDKIMTL